MKDITIRNAIETDSNSIHELLMELAAFEKILDSVDATSESTNNALFGNEPSANAIVAIVEEKIVGAAIYFFNYSTFVGKRGLYLEDIYITPEYRGNGIGTKMMIELAKVASINNCGRMEWSVLDWNAKAIEFYNNLGANILKHWKLVRMNETSINKLVQSGN